MGKKRAGQIALEMNKDKDEAVALAKEKLSPEMWKAFGKDVWLTEEGQELLIEALDAPELVPKHHTVRVMRKAPNPRVVYCWLEEWNKPIPVIVPKNLAPKLVGKMITVEEIKDATGSTFRRVRVPGAI